MDSAATWPGLASPPPTVGLGKLLAPDAAGANLGRLTRTVVSSSPARTGRQHQWAQVNPPCPQPPPLVGAQADPDLDPVRIPTEEKLLAELAEPQEGHSGVASDEYSAMDILTSKERPQSWH